MSSEPGAREVWDGTKDERRWAGLFATPRLDSATREPPVPATLTTWQL